MNFFDVLGWALAAGATGGALSMFFWLRSEQEQVRYLRARLQEARPPAPDNLKALNPPAQSRGGL